MTKKKLRCVCGTVIDLNADSFEPGCRHCNRLWINKQAKRQ